MTTAHIKALDLFAGHILAALVGIPTNHQEPTK